MSFAAIMLLLIKKHEKAEESANWEEKSLEIALRRQRFRRMRRGCAASLSRRGWVTAIDAQCTRFGASADAYLHYILVVSS
ncbi:hypothetical protein Y032_0044g1015 [Ancylostoma ceylanicum]|uniref:Uncharacterized protein n=1 Tax=Ancylostoma ceylanicum TaxID=53326 RepID=A0A016UEZ4_9BILA|nr:hypothetical protein Y032_0044g1015 [Ancylostoma ceylanicum]